MNLKKSLQNVIIDKMDLKNGKERNPLVHNFAVITACTGVAMVLAVGPRIAGMEGKSQVYAASDTEPESMNLENISEGGNYELPTGIAGMVTSIAKSPLTGTTVTRIGTSCERVMVGQRVKRVTGNADELDVGDSMTDTVEVLDAAAISMSASAKMMSDTDYDNLLRIVEAEAGTEDIKGRVLVANVIMNRLKNDEFPDTITEVVWDQRYGVPQFSPTYDGKINEVTVSDETREAVKQALNGVDYSEGALFFIQRSAAEKDNVAWFDKDLKKLFKYGAHEFYTYPDETDTKEISDTEENQKKSQKTKNEDVVQMVKK